jgi:hypothetical protein
MHREQAYINGFVKRAMEYGFNEHESFEILKEANALTRAISRGAIKPATVASKMNIHPERMARMHLHNSPGQGINARYPQAFPEKTPAMLNTQANPNSNNFKNISQKFKDMAQKDGAPTPQELMQDMDFRGQLKKLVQEKQNGIVNGVFNPSLVEAELGSAPRKRTIPSNTPMMNVARDTKRDIQNMRQLNKNNPSINY